MKKVFCLLIIASMCFSLCGCGEQDADHEYIISLLEKGEYDMAISVIEHLKARDSNSAVEASTLPEEIPAPTDAPAPDTETPAAAPASGNTLQLLIDTVNSFMDDRGGEMVKSYKNATGEKNVAVSLEHAMEYRLNNYDQNGSNAHYLMFHLSGGFASPNGSNDKLFVVLDMDSGLLLNSEDLDWNYIINFDGSYSSPEQLQTLLVNAYASYRMYDAPFVWADFESREELSSEDISAVKAKLK